MKITVKCTWSDECADPAEYKMFKPGHYCGKEGIVLMALLCPAHVKEIRRILGPQMIRFFTFVRIEAYELTRTTPA